MNRRTQAWARRNGIAGLDKRQLRRLKGRTVLGRAWKNAGYTTEASSWPDGR